MLAPHAEVQRREDGKSIDEEREKGKSENTNGRQPTGAGYGHLRIERRRSGSCASTKQRNSLCERGLGGKTLSKNIAAVSYLCGVKPKRKKNKNEDGGITIKINPRRSR